MFDYYYVNDMGFPVASSVEIDDDFSTEITLAEYNDLVANPPTLESTPLDPSLAQPELTPLEKLESIGLSVDDLRTLLNENA
jgi:hypothetical protein